MNFLALFLGKPTPASVQERKDQTFLAADDRLKVMAARREEMRRKLSEAMRKIIEDQK